MFDGGYDPVAEKNVLRADETSLTFRSAPSGDRSDEAIDQFRHVPDSFVFLHLSTVRPSAANRLFRLFAAIVRDDDRDCENVRKRA